MQMSLKRSISIALTLIMLVSLFTILPVTQAGAIADTSDPWIFKVDDGTMYDLDGKWVRFGDEDFQLSGSGTFTKVNRTQTIYSLKYGDTPIADYRTETTYRHFGSTVYVTGLGTEAHPYIFTPNMLFYRNDSTGKTVATGAKVAVGFENIATSGNASENGTAVPGDGFKGYSRLHIGTDNYAQFSKDPDNVYQPYNNSSYIGVNPNMYGWRFSYATISNGFSFDEGHDTLYYLGRQDKNENSVYLFSEDLPVKTDFSGTNKAICTVTWENQDGTTLKTMTYGLGETPSDPGITPSKSSDAAYTYSFTGFEPAYAPLDDDTTYVATYEATPKGDTTYTVDAWIFSVNDGRSYPASELNGKCYRYGGSISSFSSGGSFAVENNQITLCGKVVADIDTSHPTYKAFAGTVYVTGDGSQDAPFEFHPNYIYGDSSKTNVKDGVAIGVDAVHTQSGDKGTANPGDGFKAMSRIRVQTSSEHDDKNLYNVQFLQQLGYFRPSRFFIGVGETTYGYRYSKTRALPFSFVSGDNTLYYFETTTDGIHRFSETEPPLRTSFASADSTIHTVTWKNDDGTVLDTETYYVGVTPTYKGETPVKARSESTVYTHSGWTPNIEAVTQDTVYTATYSESTGLFKGHSLTLSGDIGVNFYLNVTDEEVRSGGVSAHFDWIVNGTAKSSDYTIASDAVRQDGWYVATCNVPAAEMNYPITASVTINGTSLNETNSYSVREYALVIINSADGTYGSKHAQLVDLVKKMLDYGAKSQTRFDRTDVPLANDGIDYTMAESDNGTPIVECIETKKSDMTAGVSDFGLSYYGTSVIYLTKTTLRHYYTVTDSSKLDAAKAAAIAAGFEYGEKGSYVYFDKTNITARNLDKAYTISFGENGDYNYSVLDYSKLVLQSEPDSTGGRLATSLYWYNKAAHAYFDN